MRFYTYIFAHAQNTLKEQNSLDGDLIMAEFNLMSKCESKRKNATRKKRRKMSRDCHHKINILQLNQDRRAIIFKQILYSIPSKQRTFYKKFLFGLSGKLLAKRFQMNVLDRLKHNVLNVFKTL